MNRIKQLAALVFLFVSFNCTAQNPQNWTSKQLMEPAVLAGQLASGKDLPLIISVGPAASIPNSVNVGMVNNKEGLEQLNKILGKTAKDRKIVVYCGCCPYEHCPNVRPAIEALKAAKFNNFYLLDLPNNMKKDWIDKGYPVAKSL